MNYEERDPFRSLHIKGIVQNSEDLAIKNGEFRELFNTIRTSQLVVMALKNKQEIRAKVRRHDQFYRVECGTREAVIDGVSNAVRADFAIVVLAGIEQKIINASDVPPMLYELCAAPNRRDGVVQRARAGRQRALRRKNDVIENRHDLHASYPCC